MEKEISLHVKCPNCDWSLMEEGIRFQDRPSIKLNVETEHDRGVLWLSSIYGDNSKKMDIDIFDQDVVDMYCPHCNKELSIAETCLECGAPLVSFVIRAGGIIRICSRNGCENHQIVFKDVSAELSKFYYAYGF